MKRPFVSSYFFSRQKIPRKETESNISIRLEFFLNNFSSAPAKTTIRLQRPCLAGLDIGGLGGAELTGAQNIVCGDIYGHGAARAPLVLGSTSRSPSDITRRHRYHFLARYHRRSHLPAWAMIFGRLPEKGRTFPSVRAWYSIELVTKRDKFRDAITLFSDDSLRIVDDSQWIGTEVILGHFVVS